MPLCAEPKCLASHNSRENPISTVADDIGVQAADLLPYNIVFSNLIDLTVLVMLVVQNIKLIVTRAPLTFVLFFLASRVKLNLLMPLYRMIHLLFSMSHEVFSRNSKLVMKIDFKYVFPSDER